MSPGRARLGVSLMFLTNGLLISSLLPRYPEVKEAFGLSNTQFGLMVIAVPVGAIVAAGAAAPLIRRFGARWVTAVGSILIAAAMVGAGLSPTVALLAVSLFAAGMVDAVVDAAQNVQGVIVEEWAGRSIINSLHAVWSLGATGGGVIGTWSSAAGVPLATQLTVGGVAWSVIAIIASLLAATPHDGEPVPEHDDEAGARDDALPGRPPMNPWLLLLPLVVLSICGTLMEEVANSWSALFMARETGAPASIAGLGFTVVLASQFVGRLVGDPMTDRWGRDLVATFGGLVVAAGMTVTVLSSGPVPALVGFGMMGFGSATLVPAAFAAAGRVPGLKHGTGIAVLGWLMRLGFLVTSPVIGVISDAAGLRAALAVPLGAGLLAAAISVARARRVAAA